MRTDNFMLHEDVVRTLLDELKPVRYTRNTVEPLLLGREIKLVIIYDEEMPRDRVVIRDAQGGILGAYIIRQIKGGKE